MLDSSIYHNYYSFKHVCRHEITDRQREAIAPLLPGKATDCGVTAKDNQLFFNAIV